MKRGNDGEKIMEPMFPRLHVNDTEKGGPRAPPRNKMALYEQLSIPSQRFNHAGLIRNMTNNTNNTAGLVSHSSQGGGNDRGMFFARQLHPMHPSEMQMQYSQYSESSTPPARANQRNQVDEDDYAVPVFIQPVPAEEKHGKGMIPESFSLSNSPYSHPSMKFQKNNEAGMFEQRIVEEAGTKKGENSNNSMAGHKQTFSLINHEPGANLGYKLRTGDSGLCNDSQNTAVTGSNTAKINSSDSEEASPIDDQTIVHDLSNDTGSDEDDSCRPLHTGNLERGESVSESSVLDTESALDITPDDIVGIIGQKQFWKARRAIMNQQRVFAVQVFELHRLVKVQKTIAAWPHLLLEDPSFFDKPTKPLSGKKRPLDSATSAASNPSKANGNSDNPNNKKERCAESTLEKVPISTVQNVFPPSSCGPSPDSTPPPPPITSNVHNNARFNNPPEAHQQQQWLIPVMSPSEGLVYKPYPAPGFSGQPNPMMGNFLPPVFGIPTPAPQYPFPSFPHYGPPGYFHPYGMPMMSTAAFSGISMEQNQMHTQSIPGYFSGPESASTSPNGSGSNEPNPHAAEEIEVQGSSASSVEERSMLPLHPTPAPVVATSRSSPRVPVPVRAPRVIKVVPRNGVSASESAARIFRSIQEERMQFDSV